MLSYFRKNSLSKFVTIQLKLAVVISIFFISNASADTTDEGFKLWLQQTSLEFHELGVSQKTLRDTLGGLKLDQKVINLDKRQPEFNLSFGEYLSKILTPKRISNGKKYLYKYRKLLDSVERIYGVSRYVLVSLWSLETNYGTYLGSYSIIRSLATLAYEGRRREFFKSELLSALLLFQTNKFDKKDFIGSWAGAMGQPQFMPSTYQSYAIDGNKDGVINLWSNMHDVFYSSANYLKKMSWQINQQWGQEVILPNKMSLIKSGLEWSLPIDRWINMGIKPANGITPPNQHQRKVSLLLPLGYGGPSYWIYDNFRTIMRWNNSINYALSVGILSDLLSEKYSLDDLPLNDWKRNYPTTIAIRKMQEKLLKSGYKVGKPDGIIGKNTRRAIIQYQIHNQLIPDGYPNTQLIEHLQINQ